MANYGIRVPNVVGDFGQGLQTAQSLNYWDDRKRKIAAQEAAQERQTAMDEQTQNRQSLSDFSKIAQNVDRSNPGQIKQALAWAAQRSPQMKEVVWDALQKSPEEQLNFIDMFQKPAENVENAYGQDIPQEKIDYWANQYNTTGKKVFPVRGKQSNALNKIIIERAAELSMAKGESGEDTKYFQSDRKAIQSSINMQEKQRGSMTSFVTNLGMQVDSIKDMADELKTLDTRLFNKPIRWFRRKVAGSPELAKYEVYLGEIQSEIGKLSSGSTASVSELSEGAREKWENILDENMSIKDMIEVLEEVKHAGYIRMESVDKGLKESRKRLRNVGKKVVDTHEKEVRAKKKKAKSQELTYNPETGGFD